MEDICLDVMKADVCQYLLTLANRLRKSSFFQLFIEGILDTVPATGEGSVTQNRENS
jgi:hypothetical protein